MKKYEITITQKLEIDSDQFPEIEKIAISNINTELKYFVRIACDQDINENSKYEIKEI